MRYSQRAMADAERIARALQRRIHDAGLTYRDVEERLGMGQRYLGQLLRGSVDLKAKHITAILEAIGVTVEDFFADALGLALREQTPADLALPATRRLARLVTLRDLIWTLEEKGVLTHDEAEKMIAGLTAEEAAL
jgi:transcriptional regulator with XRE-family HTH domain